jgi:3-oxocholest-4-en-26-oate---CoA ligase
VNPEAGGWNFADIWEHHAGRFPFELVQLHGDRSYSWADFDRRADGIATTLVSLGAQQQDKVAQYLYNGPEYLESVFGAFKAGLVPVNTNYRYLDDELVYLWDNSDAFAVVFHGAFAEICERARDRVPRVRVWLWVDDGSGPCPDWAIPYEDATANGAGRFVPAWGRSPDDLYLQYTGGTTGAPKGVMWRQTDVFAGLDRRSVHRLPLEPGWEELDARVTKPGPRALLTAPLMHGTSAFGSLWNLSMGGAIVTLTNRSFDPVAILHAVERRRAKSMTIVGDAFAKPLLRALDAEPERWDISSLRMIFSSGVMWSAEAKAGLLRHNSRLKLMDSLGSSEAIGMASNVTTADGSSASSATATFKLGPATRVLAEDGREVAPGSGEIGRVAIRGHTPLGYYKDVAKSQATFVRINGEQWSLPGDWAEVEADGTLRLHGRGSQCINTAGEKVYPEEVEEVVKRFPGVADAAVFGVPDDKFGEAVVAVVETSPGVVLDEREVIAHVRALLAAFKAPKHVLTVDTVGRAANGKLSYGRLRDEAIKRIGAATLPQPS